MNTQTGNGSTESPSPTATGSEPGDGKRRCCGREDRGCHRGGRHCGRKFLVVLGIALVAGLAGSYIGKSWAHDGPRFFGTHHVAFGGDPARTDEQMERMVRHFAVEAGATPEQQQKLSAIAKAAARDIAPLRDQLKSARGQAIELLKAPGVDRAAIERLRSEQLQLADTASRRLTLAMGDVAEVLTPEQRQKLGGRLAQWIGRTEHRGPRWFGGNETERTPATPAVKDGAKTV